MAHFGSAWEASVKALSAAAYWNEWSCAIPFRSPGCAAEEHELEKLIFPKPSENDGVAAACRPWQGASETRITKISMNLRGNIYTPGTYMYSDSILMGISVQTVEKTPLIGFQGLLLEICAA
jgi:hypothetical protein